MAHANHHQPLVAAELLEAAQRQALLVLGAIDADATAEERVKLLKAVQPVLDLSATKRTHVLHEHGLPPGGAVGPPPTPDVGGLDLG